MPDELQERKSILGGFFCRRVCTVPTWRFFVALFLVGALVAWVALKTMHPFLAVNTPIGHGLMVVEGWLSDPALEHAIAKFHEGKYEFMYVTGGPVEVGSQLVQYKTYAELCAASLTALGMDTNRLQAVPAPLVKQDRTYTSAVALKRWLELHGRSVTNLTVVSECVHARRSRLLFQKAFGSQVLVGTLAVPTDHYDMNRWWVSSPGVRAVIGEMLAYGYARFVFWPKAPEPMPGAPAH